jgi:peptidylamidoglycolate lyase
VAKFDASGKFLTDWGTPPKDPANPGPNEWNTVHSIAITADRRLFVVDRGHRRFQVFDENGKFLTMFPTGRNSSPYYHYISTDGYLWVGDGGTNRILKYDLDGHYLYGWGGHGGAVGLFSGPHQLTTDQDRNLYVAEVFNGRVQKFTPKANADPAKVAGQEKRFGAASTN